MSLLARTRRSTATSDSTEAGDRVSRLPVVLAAGARIVALLVVGGILDAPMTALVPSGMLVSALKQDFSSSEAVAGPSVVARR